MVRSIEGPVKTGNTKELLDRQWRLEGLWRDPTYHLLVVLRMKVTGGRSSTTVLDEQLRMLSTVLKSGYVWSGLMDQTHAVNCDISATVDWLGLCLPFKLGPEPSLEFKSGIRRGACRGRTDPNCGRIEKAIESCAH